MKAQYSFGKTTQQLMLQELTSVAYNEQIKSAWINKDDPEEPGSAALPHLILLANNKTGAHSRLSAAQWLCRHKYGLSAAVTALIELAFEPNNEVSTKALAQLEALDDPQATKALQGLVKWGADQDLRSTARHYLLRKTAQQKSLPQEVEPAQTEPSLNADTILYEGNVTIAESRQDVAEPFSHDESIDLALDVNRLAEPFINDELNDSAADLEGFAEPFLNDEPADATSQIDAFAEPFLNQEPDEERSDSFLTFEQEDADANKTSQKVELLTTSSMLAASDLVTDEELLLSSPLPVAMNVTASQLKVATAEQATETTPVSPASGISELLPQLLRHDYKQPLWVPSLLLALTTIGELLFLLPDPVLGMGVHIGVLFLLLYSLVYVPDRPVRRLNTVLLLVPMIRIMSFGLPLAALPKMSWYFFTSIPIFAAMFLITRAKDDAWNREELGLTLRQWPIQLGVALAGIAIGWLEYFILTPAPLSTALSLQAIWLPALILLICSGFLEELLFRGLLQSAAIPVIGRWPALFFISTLFAVLHIGYASVIDVLFVFAVGLSFALVVERTRSIFGVTLAHAIANISLYLIFPHLLG